MKRYEDLGEMLKNDGESFDYFTSLPSYARGMIARRSGNVHTLQELKNYADNLLSGDK